MNEKISNFLTFQGQNYRTAIAEAIRLAGWRIYVTNVPSEAMTLEQSVRY